MSVDLRPYQIDQIERCRRAVGRGHSRILLVLPTGGGKTIVAGSLIHGAIAKGKRALFLAHRRELVKQCGDKLALYGVDFGFIQAGLPESPLSPVQVASIQTLHRRAMQSRKMELPDAHLVVVDEAHRCRAQTYQDIINAYPDAVILGLTATPCRSDGRGLGNVFDIIVEGPSVQRLIELGFLVQTRVYAPTTPDMKGVDVRAGDYVASQLEKRMDRPGLTGDIVTHYHRLNPDRRPTVVFASGVQHSIHLRDEFRRSGVSAEHLDGSTPAEERDDILARLDRGQIDVVTNCMVLTEGWDQPAVSCAILARPTKHMGLFRQMIGRVLRPAPGKTDALVLDHAGAVFEHGFVEEPVAWTLDEDKRAESRAHTNRGRWSVPGLTTCPECAAIRMAGQACGSCGWKPTPKARDVEIADGELGRVNGKKVKQPKYTSIEKDRWHGQLAWIAVERGYKQGWVSHKYREKFGAWPRDRDPMPITPSQEVRSWVKSRQIAYAKAQESAA